MNAEPTQAATEATEMQWITYSFYSEQKKTTVMSKARVPVGATPSEMIASIRRSTGQPNLKVELFR